MRIAVRMVSILPALALVSGCSGDNGLTLEAQFSTRFEQPTTGLTSCPVTAVHFTDESGGAPTQWEWTFGDGTSSEEQNPTWEPGAVTAEITLTVSRDGAEDSITERVTTHEC